MATTLKISELWPLFILLPGEVRVGCLFIEPQYLDLPSFFLGTDPVQIWLPLGVAAGFIEIKFGHNSLN